MRTPTRTAALALAAAAPFLLVACGDDDGAADVPQSADHNAADVAFATQMIPHHAQALDMVEMTEGRELTPEFSDLVDRIAAAQAPEIDQMASWLEEWDQPVPDTDGGMSMDHGDMDHGDMDAMGDMPGMMSQEDLDELEDAEGDAFERMWMSMMIAHHEGAIEMAETELDEGEDADALELARSIAESQQAEIDEMQALLGT